MKGYKKRDIFLTGIEKVHADRIIDLFKDKGFKKNNPPYRPLLCLCTLFKRYKSELSVVIDLGGE
jgi:hypothetical protein